MDETFNEGTERRQTRKRKKLNGLVRGEKDKKEKK